MEKKTKVGFSFDTMVRDSVADRQWNKIKTNQWKLRWHITEKFRTLLQIIIIIIILNLILQMLKWKLNIIFYRFVAKIRFYEIYQTTTLIELHRTKMSFLNLKTFSFYYANTFYVKNHSTIDLFSFHPVWTNNSNNFFRKRCAYR